MASDNFQNKLNIKVDDLGLSSKVTNFEDRSINKDGSFNLLRRGEEIHIYHWMITMSWLKFFFFIFCAFTLINGAFSILYYILGGENIAGFTSKSFILDIINLFHFSVQTMTAVGYGAMHPTGIVVGVLASLEALIGLLSFALVAGLVYGRFSNPKAEIKYSKNILFTELNGKPSLQLRIANKLSHDLFDVSARLMMIHNVKDKNGQTSKRYDSLLLQYDTISFMPMNWTIVHLVNEKSPLFNKTKEDLKNNQVEFLLIVKAFDESFSQLVHSRTSYIYDEIVENAKWELAFEMNNDGERVFDLDKLDDFVKMD